MAESNEQNKVIRLDTREQKVAWMRSQGAPEDEIAVMFAIEDGEIAGDVLEDSGETDTEDADESEAYRQ